MAIKTIEYSVLDSFSPTNETLNTQSFSLDVADKAKYVVHRAVKTAKANNVQLTRSTKTRSEVRGGGRKPWKQKGTGRARAGSSRSPLWRGGGVIFGPKPKVVTHKLNKKEFQLALRTLLFNKKEINKLIGRINQEGLTLVPTKMYFVKGKAKVNIAVAKGKKLYDKRLVKKKRDWQREKAKIFSRKNK